MQRHRSLVTVIFIDMKKFRYYNKEQDAKVIASEPNLYATNEESSLLMDTDSQYGDWTPEDLMKVLQKSDKDFAEGEIIVSSNRYETNGGFPQCVLNGLIARKPDMN